MNTPKRPADFITVRVSDAASIPSVRGVCASYELGKWRREQLVTHLMEWLPEFALSYSDYEAIAGHNATSKTIQAAKAVYASPKHEKRGECGELLLHVLVRQIFGSLPAISKYYFKDSSNDTVKGFDAVHVVAAGNELELWLGEVKFYRSIARAITAVLKELEAHFKRDYLRSEFIAIKNKIDPSWPLASRLANLIRPEASLDDIFDAVVVPVLLTYDSEVICRHQKVTQVFEEEFKEEVLALRERFGSQNGPSNVRVELLLFPLESKTQLAKSFDKKLKKWQQLG